MKKRRMVLDQLRRDPRRCRFPLPNAVWEYQLKPIPFMTFSYLCYWCSQGREENKLSTALLAGSLHLAVPTVNRSFTVLTDKGLIKESSIPALMCGTGNFFTLPNEIFLLRLPPSAFICLLLVEDRKTHTCHPSYNRLAAVAGLSKNTVLKSVSVLQEMGLITVEPSSYFDRRGMKWNGNNVYTIRPIREAVDLHNQQMLRQLEEVAERMRVEKLMAKQEHPA